MAIADDPRIDPRIKASVILTGGSFGLALQIDLTEPIGVSLAAPRTRPGSRPAVTSTDMQSILFSASRPGAVLREAEQRGLPVDRG